MVIVMHTLNIFIFLCCLSNYFSQIESVHSNSIFHHPILLLNKKFEENYTQHQLQINTLSSILQSRQQFDSHNSNASINNATKVVLKRSPGQSHCPRSHDYKDGCLQIDFSQYNKLLSIEQVPYDQIPGSWLRYIKDPNQNGCFVANVQALVNMEELVDNLLPLGYIPAVVPEFKGITVGGSIQGLAAESTSFRCGLFHDIVLEFEAILSNGTILICNRTMNSELFYSLPGSFGSLAICTRAKVLCIPASPTVKIRTKMHISHQECISYMMQFVKQSDVIDIEDRVDSSKDKKHYSTANIDFLEGIGFSEKQFVSIEGSFFHNSNTAVVDNIGSINGDIINKVQSTPRLLRCAGWGAPWFFNMIRRNVNTPDTNSKFSVTNHEQKTVIEVATESNSFKSSSSSSDIKEFLLPTKDYLFRHDRGSFWMASYRIPEWIGRFLDPLLDSSNMFKLATALPWAFPKHTIVLQDFMLPEHRVDSFIQQMQEELQVWPIWLLPMYNIHSKSQHSHANYPSKQLDETSSKTDMESSIKYPIFSVSEENLLHGDHFCNVGAYGIPKLNYKFISSNQKLEDLLYLHQGRKVYYSHAFYGKSFFYNNLYNGNRYFDMRKKYCSDNGFYEIYDKIITKNGKL